MSLHGTKTTLEIEAYTRNLNLTVKDICQSKTITLEIEKYFFGPGF
jgi:hypothetical protein